MKQTNDEFNISGSTHTHRYMYISDAIISPNVNISELSPGRGLTLQRGFYKLWT